MNLLPRDETGVVMPVRMMPRDAAPDGFVHPGEILRQLDLAGALAAMRHCRTAVVTVSLDRVDFHAPCRVGEAVVFKARINATGRSSMEVGVRAEAENPVTGELRHALTAYLTYVSVGAGRKPVPVPPVAATSQDEIRRETEAGLRRDMRRDERQRERAAQDDAPLPGGERPGGAALGQTAGPETGDEHTVRAPVDPSHIAGDQPRLSPASASPAVVMPARVMPRDVNPAGNAHGGVTLDRMVQAATMAAMRHCGGAVTLESVERVDFLDPGRVDEVMTFKADVNHADEAVIEVGVRVEAENLIGGSVRHAATGYLVFVPVDEAGGPASPPPVHPATAVQHRRQAEAVLRLQARRAEREREEGSGA